MSRILGWIVDAVAVTILTAILKPLWKLAYKLAEHAVTGWADDKIAEALGVTSPGLSTVVDFVWAWGVPFLLATAVLWLYHQFNRRQGAPPINHAPANYSDKYIELMGIIWWIAERSAWGRWQKWQQLVNNGSMLGDFNALAGASSFLHRAAMNGDVHLQGRLRNEFEYNDVDQHFWRKAAFNFSRDDKTLWRAFIIPCSGVTEPLPDFDSLISERSQIEKLWPRHDLRLDWLIAKLWVRAKLRAFQTAIRTTVEPSYFMAFFLILAVIGVVGAGGTYIYQLRAKPSANSPEENQAAAPVSAAPAQNVTKPLIPPGQTIVAAQQLADKVSTIEKRTLSAYETEKRLRLIDEVFLPMLRGEIVEHVRRGYQLQSNWSNFVHSDRVKYIQDLQDFRRKSEEWNVKSGTARRDNAAFEDVISLTEPTYAQPFFDSMNSFIGMIGAIGDPPYKFDMQYIVGPKSETFQKGIQALGDWLFVTEKKIIERRKEIATP